MDPNMYPTFYSRIKGRDPLIFGKKEGYAASINQLEPKLPIEQQKQAQYLSIVPFYGLGQLVVIPRVVCVQ
jgi:hypothetical protein